MKKIIIIKNAITIIYSFSSCTTHQSKRNKIKLNLLLLITMQLVDTNQKLVNITRKDEYIGISGEIILLQLFGLQSVLHSQEKGGLPSILQTRELNSHGTWANKQVFAEKSNQFINMNYRK